MSAPHSSSRTARQAFSRGMARLVVRHPWWLAAMLAGVVACCVWTLRARQAFDSEVLDLLPADSPAVQALGTVNRDFIQGRELTFALQGEPQAVAEFGDYFSEKLRTEPWVRRVFDGPPFQNPAENGNLQFLVPGLLFNLPPAEFAGALKLLEPEAIGRRLHRLREEMDAGSPKAAFQIEADPLGLLAGAMQPLSTLNGPEKGGDSLSSEDGTVRLFLVITNQPTLSQPDCRDLLRQVGDFKKRVAQSWHGPAPRILVTGRSAYVAEISASMQRDIAVTSTVSILAVSGLFYLSFRRVVPLIGITVILGVSCLAAFALGCLIFQNLNVIAIAFCSILVGLGDDFSLLLYNRYLQARFENTPHEESIALAIQEMGPGIFFVALTTGAGFLVLLFSGSAGFAQLGVMIAVGVCLCAVFMITLLFLFIHPSVADLRPDPLRPVVHGLVGRLLGVSRKSGAVVTVLVVAVTVFALLPVKPLQFETDPKSLQPKGSPAAEALDLIMAKIPVAAEPVLILVQAQDSRQAFDYWQKLSRHLDSLVAAGEISRLSSPVGLVFSPDRMDFNRQALGADDLAAARIALVAAVEREGFNAEGLGEAFRLLDRLEAARKMPVERLQDFQAALPQSSSWWFLIDRYFSARPHLAAAYFNPTHSLTTPGGQQRLEKLIAAGGVPVQITGWTYVMTSLMSWARRELLVFGSGMSALILLFLAVAYKDWRLWLTHVVSLVFALAASVATLKLFGVRVNMLNALAFPLILGVGVDYGMHVLMALRDPATCRGDLEVVLKPIIISGLTTVTGLGSLMLARNPSLSGLGLVCALGVGWCLAASVLVALPFYRLICRSAVRVDG